MGRNKTVSLILVWLMVASGIFVVMPMCVPENASAESLVLYSENLLDGYELYYDPAYPPYNNFSEENEYVAFGCEMGLVGQREFLGVQFIYRSFISFNTSILPDDANILSVAVHLRIWYDLSSTRDFDTQLWSTSYTSWYPAWNASGVYAGTIFNTSLISSGSWYSLGLSTSLVSATGKTQFLVNSSYDSKSPVPTDGSEYIAFYNGNSTTSLPELHIEYVVAGTMVSMELDSGAWLNSTMFPEVSDWNLTYDLYYFAIDTVPGTKNITIDKAVNWTFQSVSPLCNYTDIVDNVTLEDVYDSVCYRAWFTVPKAAPYSTIHISLYNAFTGEGLVWGTLKVMISSGATYNESTAEQIPRADYALEPDTTYTLRVMDFFENGLVDYVIITSTSEVYVNIPVPIYSWQMFNMNDAAILVRIFWNNTGDPWEFFVGPHWIIERWLKGGDYTFMVTFYNTDGTAGETVAFLSTVPLPDLNASFIYVNGTSLTQIITSVEGVYALQELITYMVSPSLVIQYDSVPLAPIHLKSLSVGDALGLDPYLILETTTFDNATGTSVEMWTPHPSRVGATYYTLSDVLSFSGNYSNHVWVNTTDDVELLNQSVLPAALLLHGENITVEATESISVSRATVWREVSEFVVWYYATERKYEATLNLSNGMSLDFYAPYYFIGFPINATIELASVSVYDIDNDIYLTRGVHYEVTTGGVHMTLSVLNASDYRNFRVRYYDVNGSSDMGAPNLISESYTSATYNGKIMKYTAVQWVNPWSTEYHGEIYITLNFTGGDSLLASSIVIIDTSRSLTLSPTDYIYTGRTIIILVSGVGTVPIGGSRNYAVYFTFGGAGTPERSSLIFDPIVVNGSAWYIGAVPITVALLGIIAAWVYVGYAFYAGRKDNTVTLFIVLALTVILLYFQGVM